MTTNFFYGVRSNPADKDAPGTLLRFPSKATRDEWAKGTGNKALDRAEAQAAFPHAFDPNLDVYGKFWRDALDNSGEGAEEFA